MRLLIVEDATRLRGVLHTALTKLGHAVDAAADGHEGAALLIDHSYDVVVLDILLPGVDGMTLLERLRARGDTTPVLMLTARDGIDDRVRGLQCGADDYLVKPFALDELAARLEALHRRRHGVASSRIAAGPLRIDTAARTVHREGDLLPLTAREYALLELLALRPRRVLSREQIEAHLYAEGDAPASNAVDSAVCQLRRKLSPAGEPSLIRTRRGLGYSFEPA